MNMSIYKGQWPEKGPTAIEKVQVTVDGQSLPPASGEVPGTRLTYGWGNFSTWAGRKLLSYSILLCELTTTFGLSRQAAHKYLLDIAETFMEDKVAKLDKQWTLSSEDISLWLQAKFPQIWSDLTANRARA